MGIIHFLNHCKNLSEISVHLMKMIATEGKYSVLLSALCGRIERTDKEDKVEINFVWWLFILQRLMIYEGTNL